MLRGDGRCTGAARMRVRCGERALTSLARGPLALDGPSATNSDRSPVVRPTPSLGFTRQGSQVQTLYHPPESPARPRRCGELEHGIRSLPRNSCGQAAPLEPLFFVSLGRPAPSHRRHAGGLRRPDPTCNPDRTRHRPTSHDPAGGRSCTDSMFQVRLKIWKNKTPSDPSWPSGIRCGCGRSVHSSSWGIPA